MLTSEGQTLSGATAVAVQGRLKGHQMLFHFFFLLGLEDMLTWRALSVLLKPSVGEFYFLPLVSL